MGSLITKIASLKKQVAAEECGEESEDELPRTAEADEKNVILYNAARTLYSDIKDVTSKLRATRSNPDESMTI